MSIIKTRWHGKFCYPGGREIEVKSPHKDWCEWAANALYEAHERDKAKTEASIAAVHAALSPKDRL